MGTGTSIILYAKTNFTRKTLTLVEYFDFVYIFFFYYLEEDFLQVEMYFHF